MTDISNLIKEARPLYFKRKKRRQRIKIAAGFLGCCMAGLVAINIVTPRNTISEEIYTAFYNDTVFEEAFALYQPEENAGFLDEYGLIKIVG